jgi:hypothetical protein
MTATATAEPKIQKFLRRLGGAALGCVTRGEGCPTSGVPGVCWRIVPPGGKNRNERAASPTLDAFSSMDWVGVIDLAAHRTCNVDHVAAPTRAAQ